MNRVAQLILLFSLFLLAFLTLVSDSSSNSQMVVQQLLCMQERVDGNIRIIEYVNDQNELTINKSLGYATMIQYLDEYGRPIKEAYFDEQGEPCKFVGGYFGVQRKYTEDGLVSSYSYIDECGRLTIAGKGCATVYQTFYNDGTVKEELYYDLMNQPVSLSLGQYGVRYSYSSNEDSKVITYIDSAGEPMQTNKGYTSVKSQYNKEGQVVQCIYQDENGDPYDIGRGKCGESYYYENGQYFRTVDINSEGRELFNVILTLRNTPWIVILAALSLGILSLFLGNKLNWSLLVIYCLFILYVTLFTRDSGPRQIDLQMFQWYKKLMSGTPVSIDTLYNIWLFLPLGSILASVSNDYKICSFTKCMIAAIALSAFIEVLQLMFGLGLCELDDIICNSLGTVEGLLFYKYNKQGLRNLANHDKRTSFFN